MKNRELLLGREKEAGFMGVTRISNVRWGSCLLVCSFFFFLAYRGEDASRQGHEPLPILLLDPSKTGRMEHGADINFRLFHARFLIGLSVIINKYINADLCSWGLRCGRRIDATNVCQPVGVPPVRSAPEPRTGGAVEHQWR
jgi:hypothetical protein